MSDCEELDCEYCITHDEDRSEYCWIYDTSCDNVFEICNKHKLLKEKADEESN